MAFVHLDTVLGSVFLYNCAPTENAFFLFITFERRNALIVICTTAISAYFLSINPTKTIKQMDSKPDDYLVWSILVTVFCFVPTGIVAIVYSSRVDNAWYRGDKQYACEMAQKAKKYCLISLVVAIVIVFLVGIVLVFG
jgi:hypothetical protein